MCLFDDWWELPVSWHVDTKPLQLWTQRDIIMQLTWLWRVWCLLARAEGQLFLHHGAKRRRAFSASWCFRAKLDTGMKLNEGPGRHASYLCLVKIVCARMKSQWGETERKREHGKMIRSLLHAVDWSFWYGHGLLTCSHVLFPFILHLSLSHFVSVCLFHCIALYHSDVVAPCLFYLS